ncbi:hypothetical protein DPEC_G00349360 [Dallia pectoralis]|uniref:Uncharacterized protein n=1 Tax=Dallia pectoralis TaxID=75939 RepID=A0ACC2F1B2_DALPE|nr:hypothetical protein DPEC_G00349360 [Dallia pectoralis]
MLPSTGVRASSPLSVGLLSPPPPPCTTNLPTRRIFHFNISIFMPCLREKFKVTLRRCPFLIPLPAARTCPSCLPMDKVGRRRPCQPARLVTGLVTAPLCPPLHALGRVFQLLLGKSASSCDRTPPATTLTPSQNIPSRETHSQPLAGGWVGVAVGRCQRAGWRNRHFRVLYLLSERARKKNEAFSGCPAPI